MMFSITASAINTQYVPRIKPQVRGAFRGSEGDIGDTLPSLPTR